MKIQTDLTNIIGTSPRRVEIIFMINKLELEMIILMLIWY